MPVSRVVFVVALISLSGAEPPKRSRVSVVKFGCSFDEKLVKDSTCLFKPIRNELGFINIGLTPITPWPTVWIQMDSFRKNSANQWQRGKLHIVQNLCIFAEDKNNFINYLMGAFKESVVDHFIQKCPYTKRFGLVNYTLERQQMEATLNLYPLLSTGDYMINFTFSSAESGKGFISNIFIVFYVKGNSMTMGW